MIYTDEAKQYGKLADDFAGHDFTTHSKGEYVKREKPEVHTNTVEGLYSIFKRGMKGVYQHCGKRHLHRYAALRSLISVTTTALATALMTSKGLLWHYLAQ